MTEPVSEKSGWALLHSKLPSAALKPLPKSAYGIEGLTDVNEAYLIQRLFASGLEWEWRPVSQTYLGFEDRQAQGKTYTTRWYLASFLGDLVIDGRHFAGSGGHDNHKLDASFKGASTVAFKNACKAAGLTIELYKDGRAMDFIYEDRDGNVIETGASQRPTGEGNGSTRASSVVVSQPVPTPSQGAPSPAPVDSAGQAATNDVTTPAPTTTAPPAAELNNGGAGSEVAAPPAVSSLSGASVSRRMGRSIGPAPKRTNVVTVEQGAEKPATAPEVAPSPVVSAEPAPSQGAPLDLIGEPVAAAPVDDGLNPQRELLRQAAAELFHVNTILRNKLEHALKNEALEPVPPATPTAASDEGLGRLIERDFAGKTLAGLDGEAIQNRLELVESNLNKKKALMADKGIKDE